MTLIFRLIPWVIGKLIGGQINKKRRQRIQSDLLAADLSDGELADLGPYVQTAVEHGGLTRKAITGFMTVIALIVVWVGLQIGEGGFIAFIFAGMIGLLAYLGGYRPLQKAGELEDTLRQNPRWLLGPDYDGRYEKLVDNVDYDPDTYGTYDDVTPSQTTYPPAGTSGPTPSQQGTSQQRASTQQAPRQGQPQQRQSPRGQSQASEPQQDTAAQQPPGTGAPQQSAQNRQPSSSSAEMRSCPSCGARLQPNTTQCPDCGANVTS